MKSQKKTHKNGWIRKSQRDEGKKTLTSYCLIACERLREWTLRTNESERPFILIVVFVSWTSLRFVFLLLLFLVKFSKLIPIEYCNTHKCKHKCNMNFTLQFRIPCVVKLINYFVIHSSNRLVLYVMWQKQNKTEAKINLFFRAKNNKGIAIEINHVGDWLLNAKLIVYLSTSSSSTTHQQIDIASTGQRISKAFFETSKISSYIIS